MTVQILLGDCRSVLRTLPDASVHCCVTSPPYWGLRSYLPEDHPEKHLEIGSEPTLEAWVATMVEVFREVRRVLRDDGTLWLNLGDSYAGSRNGPQGEASTLAGNGHQGGGPKRRAVPRPMTASARRDDHPIPRSDMAVPGLKPKDLVGQPWRVAFALQADGWWLRQEIIWGKKNPMPESCRDRFTKAHEHVFLLAKSDRYYFDAASIAEPALEPRGPGNVGPVTAPPGERDGNNANIRGSLHKIGARETRNPRSVRWLASEPFSGAHFATYPTELIEPFIKAGCPVGGIVLDPFGGSGTTGLVADRQHKNAILIDLDERNLPMATSRIQVDAPLFAEVT